MGGKRLVENEFKLLPRLWREQCFERTTCRFSCGNPPLAPFQGLEFLSDESTHMCLHSLHCHMWILLPLSPPLRYLPVIRYGICLFPQLLHFTFSFSRRRPILVTPLCYDIIYLEDCSSDLSGAKYGLLYQLKGLVDTLF